MSKVYPMHLESIAVTPKSKLPQVQKPILYETPKGSGSMSDRHSRISYVRTTDYLNDPNSVGPINQDTSRLLREAQLVEGALTERKME